jgi:hypothetical protein
MMENFLLFQLLCFGFLEQVPLGRTLDLGTALTYGELLAFLEGSFVNGHIEIVAAQASVLSVFRSFFAFGVPPSPTHRVQEPV